MGRAGSIAGIFALTWAVACDDTPRPKEAGPEDASRAVDAATGPRLDAAFDVGTGSHDAAHGGDGGEHDAEVIFHDLTELTVQGKVTVGYGSDPAPRVHVVAHCNAVTKETDTDDAGRFEFTSNVRECNRLVVEFEKESFLPVLRTVPLPPPTSPVTMDVAMAELKQVICGQNLCTAENDRRIRLPPGQIARGWAEVFSGSTAVSFLPGEYRDADGNALIIPSFAYLDLREQSGRVIDDLANPFTFCAGVDFGARAQLADVDDDTHQDGLQMPVYRLDRATGRWVKQSVGYIGVTEGVDANGDPNIRPARTEELGDIRSGQVDQSWLCGTLTGSGFIAFGEPIKEGGCLKIHVTDACGRALPDAIFRAEGRDYSYLAATWTDRKGDACIEAPASEEVTEDLNQNRDQGETIWVNVAIRTPDQGSGELPATAMPTMVGSCRADDTCVPFTYQVPNLGGGQCPQ
jgi:hypothetical protein